MLVWFLFIKLNTTFPKKWTNKLIKIDYLKELCNNFSNVIVEGETTDKYNLESFVSIQKKNMMLSLKK